MIAACGALGLHGHPKSRPGLRNIVALAGLVVAFFNQRGTAKQHVEEGKNAVTWTWLSCMRFAEKSYCLYYIRAA